MILRINYSQAMSPLSYHFTFQKPITQNIFKKLLKLGIYGMSIHNGKLFSQIDGIAMGNPLCLTLASWFLGMIEKKIFDQHFFFYPSFYVRYVDNSSSIHQQMLKCS